MTKLLVVNGLLNAGMVAVAEDGADEVVVAYVSESSGPLLLLPSTGLRTPWSSEIFAGDGLL